MFDLDLAAVFADPDPCAALAAERARGWIARSEAGVHVLGFDQAYELLRDPRFHPDVVATIDGAGLTDPTVRAMWMTALLGSAPADHDRLRRLVAPYFTRRAISSLRDYVAELTTRLATPLGGTHADVAEALAAPIPPAVFTRMIGAPESDAPKIGDWSATILQIFARQPELAPQITSAVHELLHYVDGFIEDRRRSPGGDDMITALLAAEDDGDRLSTHELRALVLEALEASTDNTSSALATLLYAGAQHPDEWQALREDPSRIPAFAEEAARLWPRVVHISRSATQDVEWRGRQFPAGTELLVSVPSTLRDPAAFPDPERFDPRRDSPSSHNLNFGSGGHHCIGAALARMELTTALEVLTRLWERIELDGDPVIDANVGVVTLRSLPLRITAAA